MDHATGDGDHGVYAVGTCGVHLSANVVFYSFPSLSKGPHYGAAHARNWSGRRFRVPHMRSSEEVGQAVMGASSAIADEQGPKAV